MSATAEDVTQQQDDDRKKVTPPVGEDGEVKEGEESAAKKEGEEEGATTPPVQKDPWYNRRIGQLTREKHDERRAKQALEEENRQLKARLAPASDDDSATTTQQQPAQQQPTGDMDQQVTQRAQQIVQQQEFTKRCNEVYQQGSSDERTPGFQAAIGNFDMLGGLVSHPALLELSLNMDDGHLVLHHLGNNLDEAQRILSLPPARQAVELTKLSLNLAKPVNKTSQAPTPGKPIQSPAPVSEAAGPDDEGKFATQAAYKAWRDKQFTKR